MEHPLNNYTYLQKKINPGGLYCSHIHQASDDESGVLSGIYAQIELEGVGVSCGDDMHWKGCNMCMNGCLTHLNEHCLII